MKNPKTKYEISLVYRMFQEPWLDRRQLRLLLLFFFANFELNQVFLTCSFYLWLENFFLINFQLQILRHYLRVQYVYIDMDSTVGLNGAQFDESLCPSCDRYARGSTVSVHKICREKSKSMRKSILYTHKYKKVYFDDFF